MRSQKGIILIFFIMYQITQIMMLPFFLLYLLIRKIKKKSIGNIKQRLAYVPINQHAPQQTLWFHAVSVGEVASLECIVAEIKKTHPHTICYLTTGTIGGMATAQKAAAFDVVSYLPFDFLVPMLFAFARIKPHKIIIIEAEIWPNLLMLARAKNIPTVLLNGRINKKSAQKRSLMGFLYHLFSHIYTQTDHDQAAFIAMGIAPKKITVLGDIKAWNFWHKKEKLLPQLQPTQPHPHPILLAGSIHPGEIDVIVSSFIHTRAQHPSFKMIIAPRHFHWLNQLKNKLQAQKLNFIIWDAQTDIPSTLSELHHVTTSTLCTYDVIVVARLGLLFSLIPCSSIYFLGGTIIPLGGHNLFEPAAWEKPCISGPHLHKCAAIAPELIHGGGLYVAHNECDLTHHLCRLIQHPHVQKQAGNQNNRIIQHHVQRIEKVIPELVSQHHRSS